MRIMVNPNRGRGGSSRGSSHHPAWSNGVNGIKPTDQGNQSQLQSQAPPIMASSSGEGDASATNIANGGNHDHHVTRGRGGFRGVPRGTMSTQAPYNTFGPPRGGFRGRGGFVSSNDRGRGMPFRGSRGRGRGGPPQQIHQNS